MSRWVTFYKHIMMNGVSNLAIHKNKEEATGRFKCLCKDYFHVYGNDVDNAKLPATFGLGFRYVCGMSYPSFKKKMMAEYNLSEDEFDEKIKVIKNA